MSKRVSMVRGRNYKLRTLTGHTVKFEKNVPVDVPAEAVTEAMAIGAFPVEEDTVDIGDEVVNNTPDIPVGAEREELLLGAMANMQVENKRGDFDASGFPNLKKLSARVNFDVAKQERDKLWNLMQEESAE